MSQFDALASGVAESAHVALEQGLDRGREVCRGRALGKLAYILVNDFRNAACAHAYDRQAARHGFKHDEAERLAIIGVDKRVATCKQFGEIVRVVLITHTDHPLGRRRVGNRLPGAIQVSAARGTGLDDLKARIAERFADRFEEVRLLVPYDKGAVLADLYALGAPIDERTDTEAGVLVRARLPHREVRRFAPYLVAGLDAKSLGSA